MSSGHGHKGVSSLGDHEVDQALAQHEVRKALARTRRVDRNWDIPYLGGYSVDGRTVYLDRHLPKRFVTRGESIETDRFLILHEEVEKTLIDMLGFTYAHAHQVATHAEEDAVRAAGINLTWYRHLLKPYIKADEHERLVRVPRDLDLTPYRSPPVDEALWQRLMRAMDHPEPRHPTQESRHV